MHSTLTPSCTLGSPQRKLNVRPQTIKSPRRHQNAYAVSSENHAWITKTLQQLHSSTSARAMATPRQSTLCSICRTPLVNPYYNSCGGRRSSTMHKRSRPHPKCYSVAPALQTSKGDTGSGPPNDGSNGGGGNGDGSGNPSGNRHHETPLTEAQQIKGLEDVLLLDVQG